MPCGFCTFISVETIPKLPSKDKRKKLLNNEGQRENIYFVTTELEER
jgi:hypothetical protein